MIEIINIIIIVASSWLFILLNQKDRSGQSILTTEKNTFILIKFTKKYEMTNK